MKEACLEATKKSVRVIALMGGDDFWSNGIHLNSIEISDNPADESWNNINAMNDLIEAIIITSSQIIISALRSNAGAGGAILSLSADYVFIRDEVILNLHYKLVGLHGSEYWTYLLPGRTGEKMARQMDTRNNRLIWIGIITYLFLPRGFVPV